MIYQLKVTLEKTKTWRRLHVDEDMTFAQLHALLQIAFDWNNVHVHQFTSSDIPPDKFENEDEEADDDFELEFEDVEDEEEDEVEAEDEDELQLATIGDIHFDDGLSEYYFDEEEEIVGDWLYIAEDSCLYTYDLGAKWQHRIVLEKKLMPVREALYPNCAEAEDAKKVIKINRILEGSKNSLNGPDFEERKQEAMGEGNRLKALFDQADQFKRMAPWKWMHDDDVFAVLDEASGKIGYCSILGAGKEVFGLAVYLGDRGLRTLLKILHNEKIEQDILFEQSALVLTFVNRSDLTDREYTGLQYLGLKYRGSKAWPSFRSYEPGYMPWELNESEMMLMGRALEQSIIVAERVRKGEDLLSRAKERELLTRCLSVKSGVPLWTDEWLDISDLRAKVKKHELYLSEFQIASIKKQVKQGRLPQVQSIWECGLIYLPVPIHEYVDERPFFPKIFVCVEEESGLVLHHEVMDGELLEEEELQKQLLLTFQNTGRIPTSLVFEEANEFAILLPLCELLNIKMKQVNKLREINSLKKSMMEMKR